MMIIKNVVLEDVMSHLIEAVADLALPVLKKEDVDLEVLFVEEAVDPLIEKVPALAQEVQIPSRLQEVLFYRKRKL